MGRWRRLPVEIRSMILEIVAENYRFKSEQYAGAGYASVCREWQPVFEQRNFRRLVLLLINCKSLGCNLVVQSASEPTEECCLRYCHQYCNLWVTGR